MTEQLDVQQMAQRLLAADNILILCHKNPDGDTIGCGSALYYALKALEKTTAVLCSDAIPSRYAFTNPRLFKGEFEPRTVIAVDVAGLQLFGENNGVPQFARHVDLCIDHHGSNMLYADKVWLEPDSASTAEMIYLLLAARGDEITPDIASCLFTGVTTDTGCFRFSNTTVRTYEIAAKLAELGADTYNIIQVFFETKTKTYAALERLALDSMRMYFSDRCALICITQDMYKRSGSDESETDRIANLPRQIEGVLVGITMRELKDGSYKASVRTHGDIDASSICKRLGGGGHMGAAGCTLYGSKQQAINSLLKEVQAELDSVTID